MWIKKIHLYIVINIENQHYGIQHKCFPLLKFGEDNLGKKRKKKTH